MKSKNQENDNYNESEAPKVLEEPDYCSLCSLSSLGFEFSVDETIKKLESLKSLNMELRDICDKCDDV